MINMKSIGVRVGASSALVIALVVILPLIWYAFLATLGLLGIGLVGLAGFAVMKALPLIAQKWENKILQLQKEEARQRPLEQFDQSVKLRTTRLESFRTEMETIGSLILTHQNSLANEQRNDPGADYSDLEEALRVMQQAYNRRKGQYADAVVALKEYTQAVNRAKFKYNFGTSMENVANAMNLNDEKMVMDKLLADEAFQAVSLKYNNAFSALDLEQARDDALSAKVRLVQPSKPFTIDHQVVQPISQPIIK